MPEQIKCILQLYRKKLETISDGHIKKIVLYGSYARGDFKEGSDIDVMILVDMEEFKEYEDEVINLTYDFNLEQDTDIMPIVQSKAHFDYWKGSYMFYHNISKEGVEL